jgi:hypothetical protein
MHGFVSSRQTPVGRPRPAARRRRTTRSSSGIARAVDWWEGNDEAVTPFDDLAGNPYTVSDFDEAGALEEQAQVQFDEGADADDQGDVFELAAVFFALTLFFGGIATLFRKHVVTTSLLGVAVVTLAVGGVNLVRAF